MPVSKHCNKKSKKKSTKKTSARAAHKAPLTLVPDPAPSSQDIRAKEGKIRALTPADMHDELADRREDALYQAQELVYDAWESESPQERVRLAKRALKLSDLCADAHSLLAEEEAQTTAELRAGYERAAAAGERAIGARAFEEDVGHFWGILETRPYMRARFGLADCMWELGERAAAIEHCSDMLRLNPNDNQGLRYVLAGWLLTVREHGALEDLLRDYDEDSMEWGYTKTLLALRKGETNEANAALAAAWKRNPHVPAFLNGTAPIPQVEDDYAYILGSVEEAAFYMLHHMENWASTEGAVPWLSKSIESLPPPERRRR